MHAFLLSIYFRVYSNYIEIEDKKGNDIIVTKGDFNIGYNYISRAFSPLLFNNIYSK